MADPPGFLRERRGFGPSSLAFRISFQKGFTSSRAAFLEGGMNSLFNAQRMLSLIRLGSRLHDTCEDLGGFRNPLWMELVYGSGEISVGPVNVLIEGRPLQVSLVRLIHFDNDYENFLLAQVWFPGSTRWEFALFFNTGANQWVPEVVWWWPERPSYALVGTAVESFGKNLLQSF